MTKYGLYGNIIDMKSPDISPLPSPESLMGRHQQLKDDGYRKLYSAWPDPETGLLDYRAFDETMTELEEKLGTANVTSIGAVFDKTGHIKAMGDVETIYVRDVEPRLF